MLPEGVKLDAGLEGQVQSLKIGMALGEGKDPDLVAAQNKVMGVHICDCVF